MVPILRAGLVFSLCLAIVGLAGCGTQVVKSATNGPIPDFLDRVLISYTLTGMTVDAQAAVGDELVKGLLKCGVSAALLDGMTRRSEVAQFDPEYELKIVWTKFQTVSSQRMGTSRDVALSASLYNYRTKVPLWTAELEYVDPGTAGSDFLARDFSKTILSKLKRDDVLKNCK